MARSDSISTTLAEVTPYWEPALWVLIVVVTAGIVGSALWAPSRRGRRRGQRKLLRRNDAKVRREERSAAATMVAASGTSADNGAAAPDFYADPDFDRAVTSPDEPAVPTEPPASDPAPVLHDQVHDVAPTPAPLAPVAPLVPVAEPVGAAPEQAPDSIAVNGTSTPERRVEPVAQPVEVVHSVAYADVAAGFARLASDVAALADQVTFFDERSNVPPEMPTWPIEHQQALADRAAEALADPVDQLLEHSLAVASGVRALDRLLGGRSHDADSAQAIAANRADLDMLGRHLGCVRQRFMNLARDLAALSGTAEQLAKVASIVDATDAVMGSWEPTMIGAVRSAAAHR